MPNDTPFVLHEVSFSPMKCPVCQVELKIADRAGIEIDYCPNCRGVWLDRGELDKIIERHIQETSGRVAYPDAPREPYQERYSREEYDYDEPHKPRRRKKRDWLEDLFDIFD